MALAVRCVDDDGRSAAVSDGQRAVRYHDVVDGIFHELSRVGDVVWVQKPGGVGDEVLEALVGPPVGPICGKALNLVAVV